MSGLLRFASWLAAATAMYASVVHGDKATAAYGMGVAIWLHLLSLEPRK